MRLSDIIRQCREAGATEIELHPTGEIARMVFGVATEKPKKKKLTREEEIEADKKKRNPRRDAIDLAVEVATDLRRDANGSV